MRKGKPNAKSFVAMITQAAGGADIVEGLKSQRDQQSLAGLREMLTPKLNRYVEGMNRGTLAQYIEFGPGEDGFDTVSEDEVIVLVTPIGSLGMEWDGRWSGRQRQEHTMVDVIVCAIYDLIRHDIYLANERARSKQYANM